MIFFSDKKNDTLTSGHIGCEVDLSLTADVFLCQACGNELAAAMLILQIKELDFRVYTFVGLQAQTIFANWK